MKPIRNQDNLLAKLRTSVYKEAVASNSLEASYSEDNKTLIITPFDGQDDFPTGDNYVWYKNEEYDKYRVTVSTASDFSTTEQVGVVTAQEIASTIAAGAGKYIKVVPVESSFPGVVDEITGISISAGTIIEIGSSEVFTISTTGTGNYDESFTASGAGLSFSISGNQLTVTESGGADGDEKTFTVTSVEDGAITASRTLTVDDPSVIADPVISDDSIIGDLTALNELYEQTGGPDGFWDNTTGWPISDTSQMGDAFGITVWPSGTANEGRVRYVDLRDNGLRNIQLNVDGAPVIVDKDSGLEIDVINGDAPVILRDMGGSGTTPTVAVDDANKYKERYLLIDNKELKPSIGNLQACEEFSIILNQIGGPIPDQMWALGSMVRYAIGAYDDTLGGNPPADPIWSNDGRSYPTKYNQWYNKFEGRIHPNIGTLMPNLKSLYAQRNYFDETPIPDSLWDIPLEHLAIGHCGFNNVPTKVPAFANTCVWFVVYAGTAHTNRNTQDSFNHPNNINFGTSLIPNLGFLSQVETFRFGPPDVPGPYPPEYVNMESLFLFEENGDQYTGDFPLFLNKTNMPNLNTLNIGGENINPLGGLPSDYNVSDVSGKIVFGRTPIGGVTPDGWRDRTHPLALSSRLQILNLINCGIGGPFYEDMSDFDNMKFVVCQGNNFNNTFFTDYPLNNRLTNWKWNGSPMTGPLVQEFRKIISTKLYSLDYGNMEINGYEQGALGAVSKDVNGDFVDGYRGYKNISLNNNQLTTPDLNQIIIDVADNIESRIGETYEADPINLFVNAQKTGQSPDLTNSLVTDAIAYIESQGGSVTT